MTCGIWFKRIRLALRLTRRDVVEIMRLGGMTISSSHVDGWVRHGDDDRSRSITAAEFDAFTDGLVAWSKIDRTSK